VAAGSADFGQIRTLLPANTGAVAALTAGLLVVFRRRNSNALADELAGSWLAAAAIAGALVLAVLQLGTVAPFLYFNF